jgi:V/A-type H+/Na+-transporting ATPase subunit D
VTDDAPRTRASLLALRQARADAREGHALLEHKREVLLREVAELLRVGRQHEARLRSALAAALGALRAARLDGGRDAVDSALLVSSADTACRVTPRSLMGVALPGVTLHVRPEPLTTSAGGTPASLDVARRRWLDTAGELATWAETYGSVWRVANELARTQRRVNALEQVLIPEQEAAIRAIEAMLEEADRESFVRTKRVKARLVRDRSEEPDA